MKLDRSDYLLTVACKQFAYILKALGDVETRLYQQQLTQAGIVSPVFVTGLARSGTTILLTLLAKLPGIATHRYRDFPFVFLPCFWNRFLEKFSAPQQDTERLHRDGIRITRDSPDAFEEPIWQYFFPHLHDRQAVHLLAGNVSAPGFECFYRDHIRKILLLRGGTRYLSKGNYNVTRIPYLARLFPDARFIIPVRHPYRHVESLVQQHRLFSGYAENDARIGKYLEAAGHYEFGPQRVPIGLSTEVAHRTEAAWGAGQEYRGYAIQWQALYSYVKMLLDDPMLRNQVMLLRFEDLCGDPHDTLQHVFGFLGIDIDPATAGELEGMIKRPSGTADHEGTDNLAAVREETAAVAKEFGYHDL